MEKKPKHLKQRKDFKHRAANKADGRLSGPSNSNLDSRHEDKTEDIPPDSDGTNTNTKTYSKRQIVTNWSKYETDLPPSDATHYNFKAADFKSLLNAPTSQGGHFKFKSESSWETYSPSQYSNIFSLDLHKLAAGVQCIPFYEQLNLSKDLFDNDELISMNLEAQQNRDQYSLSLKQTTQPASENEAFVAEKLGTGMNTSMSTELIAKTRETPQQTHFDESFPLNQATNYENTSMEQRNVLKETVENSAISEKQSEVDDDLDFLLTLKEPLATVQVDASATQHNVTETMDDVPDRIALLSQQTPATIVEKNDNLEDWLDSILDD